MRVTAPGQPSADHAGTLFTACVVAFMRRGLVALGAAVGGWGVWLAQVDTRPCGCRRSSKTYVSLGRLDEVHHGP